MELNSEQFHFVINTMNKMSIGSTTEYLEVTLNGVVRKDVSEEVVFKLTPE